MKLILELLFVVLVLEFQLQQIKLKELEQHYVQQLSMQNYLDCIIMQMY